MAEARQMGISRLVAFDGLRGVAAIAVAFFHCELWLGRQLGHGYLAVDVFFLLSGVVLDRAYGARLRAGWPVWAFMRARLARLYPAYLAGLAVSFGVLALAAWLDRPGLAMPAADRLVATGFGLLFLPSPLVGGYEIGWPMNPAAWSLLFELVANLVFALTIGDLSIRRLAAFTACGALFLAACVGLWRNMELGWNLMTLPGGLARAWFAFFAGILVARLHEHGATRVLPRLGLPVLAAILCGILALPRGIPFGPFVALGVVLMVFPALVALAIRAEPGPRMAAVCAWLGALSYPVYVIHYPLIRLADLLVPAARTDMAAAWIATGLALTTTLAMAWLGLRWGPAVLSWRALGALLPRAAARIPGGAA